MLCGCFGEENKTETEKLIGTWEEEESNYRMYKFFADGTCLINTYDLEGTFYINDEGHLVINQTNPAKSYVFEYYINYDNTKLTITDINSEERFVFRKQ